jgi:hypothetical protein
MNITDYLIAKKIFGGGSSPAVDPNSIVGTWKFNEEIEYDGTVKTFDVTFCTGAAHDVLYVQIISGNYEYASLQFLTPDGTLSDVYDDGWYEFSPERSIYIPKDPADDAFASWLKANATKISGGTEQTFRP